MTTIQVTANRTFPKQIIQFMYPCFVRFKKPEEKLPEHYFSFNSILSLTLSSFIEDSNVSRLIYS